MPDRQNQHSGTPGDFAARINAETPGMISETKQSLGG